METIVNGKVYPLWNQFVSRKNEWIGGILEDFGGSFGKIQTKITDIQLNSNGKDSAFFEVKGKGFDCGFDVHVGGIIAGEEGWLTLSGYGGHKWRIKQKEK